ncbi:MAG: hypothetical protein R3C03_24070 [Pirellulaceae bacterium]
MSQLELRFSKEQFEQRCSAIECLAVDGWSPRRSRVVRRFIKDVFKAKWSSADGTCIVNYSFLAKCLDQSIGTVKNWVKWAEEAELICKSVSANEAGRKRMTIEINWRTIGIKVEANTCDVKRSRFDELGKLFYSINLKLWKKFQIEFANIDIDHVKRAIDTYKANKDNGLLPESVIHYLRYGAWPGKQEIKTPEQIQAINESKQRRRDELRISSQKIKEIEAERREVDSWWQSLSDDERHDLTKIARADNPFLSGRDSDSPLIRDECWHLVESGGVGPLGSPLHGL